MQNQPSGPFSPLPSELPSSARFIGHFASISSELPKGATHFGPLIFNWPSDPCLPGTFRSEMRDMIEKNSTNPNAYPPTSQEQGILCL